MIDNDAVAPDIREYHNEVYFSEPVIEKLAADAIKTFAGKPLKGWRKGLMSVTFRIVSGNWPTGEVRLLG